MTHATTHLQHTIERAMVCGARTMHIRISPHTLERIKFELNTIEDANVDLGGATGVFCGVPFTTTMATRGFVVSGIDASGIPFSLEWNGEA